MENYFIQISAGIEPPVYFLAACIIMFLGSVVWSCWKMRSVWTLSVKYAVLRLIFLGILPFFTIGWFSMLGTRYSKELMAIALYFAGVSVILLHKHASIFLRELPLMQEYPHPKYHLRLLYEIKNQRLFYILLTVYFFLMGTLILLYLPG